MTAFKTFYFLIVIQVNTTNWTCFSMIPLFFVFMLRNIIDLLFRHPFSFSTSPLFSCSSLEGQVQLKKICKNILMNFSFSSLAETVNSVYKSITSSCNFLFYRLLTRLFFIWIRLALILLRLIHITFFIILLLTFSTSLAKCHMIIHKVSRKWNLASLTLYFPIFTFIFRVIIEFIKKNFFSTQVARKSFLYNSTSSSFWLSFSFLMFAFFYIF